MKVVSGFGPVGVFLLTKLRPVGRRSALEPGAFSTDRKLGYQEAWCCFGTTMRLVCQAEELLPEPGEKRASKNTPLLLSLARFMTKVKAKKSKRPIQVGSERQFSAAVARFRGVISVDQLCHKHPQ